MARNTGNHRVVNKPSNGGSLVNSGGEKLACANVPYPEPVDYSLIRQTKTRCEVCARSIVGACNISPLACSRFTPLVDDRGYEFALDRYGTTFEGGFAEGWSNRRSMV